jgi:dihydroxyacetone kinase
MQKIINDPDRFVDEMLEGALLAYPRQLRSPARRVMVRADAPVTGKVAIVTGGGSGHLPVFMGYVGRGLADGAAIGEVFASPSSDVMLETMRAVHGGAGILQLYGNYTGDVMNFSLAAEIAVDEGIEVATVLGTDDVASAPRGEESERRGIAGIFFLYKIAGARAEEGGSLADVQAVTERAAGHLRTMGVALSPCVVPAAGRATFELPVGEMEIGMGIHGEPGIRRVQLQPADRIAETIIAALLDDLPYTAGDEAAVLVNGLGATPREELFLLYRRAHKLMETQGIRVHSVHVGEYATSLEMAGASISLLKLDDELTRLVDAPAESPFMVLP